MRGLKNVTSKSPTKAGAVAALKRGSGRRSVTMLHYDPAADVFIGHCLNRGRGVPSESTWGAVTGSGVWLGSFESLEAYCFTRGL